MARPEEKAQAMLNKWTAMRTEHDRKQSALALGKSDRTGKRPYLSSLCSDRSDCDFWRKQINGEVSNAVKTIQNRGLAESAVRDLNDRINKLLREKYHWNKRLRELGGEDYNKLEKASMDVAAAAAKTGEGQATDLPIGLKGAGGYLYFGAARDLPGVKELFAASASKIMKRSRGDIHKLITPDYYGFRDEEDGVLLEMEDEEERERAAGWEAKRVKTTGGKNGGHLFAHDLSKGKDDDGTRAGGVRAAEDGGVIASVPVPSQDLIARAVLEKKRRELLDKFS